MNRNHRTALAAVAACGLLMLGCDNNRSGMRDDDVVVTIDQVPAAARSTIEQHLNGGTIQRIERSMKNGREVYEVDARGPNGDLDLDVAADGTLIELDN